MIQMNRYKMKNLVPLEGKIHLTHYRYIPPSIDIISFFHGSTFSIIIHGNVSA